METQPQLLLLQKTMLFAEAIGRRLNPALNMWAFARPLIEDWVAENLSPEARLRDSVDDGLALAQRLPKLVADAEAALGAVADGGLKLHPETVRALAEAQAGRRAGAPYLWAALAALALAVALLA